MMTRREALIELRDKVRAGTWRDMTPAYIAFKGDGPTDCRYAYNGSLDAAKALHEAVLPGWGVQSFNLSGEVVLRRIKPLGTAYGDAMRSGEVSRAWLLAILEALIAQEGDA
jgi:hypothetical protein